MEIKLIVVSLIGLISLLYGLWGVVIVLKQDYATRVGGVFRKLYGVSSDGSNDEKSYDRYTRGVGAIILGFGIAFGAFRAVLMMLGYL
jgi:hypothetical protein